VSVVYIEDKSLIVVSVSLQYPQKVTESLSADFHQKLHMTFLVMGSMHDEPIKVHQVIIIVAMGTILLKVMF